MQLYQLKLVTIIAEEILKERLVHKVLELGASGCSYHSTQGVGSRNARHDDVFGENVQMKVVCAADVAENILTFISEHYFEQYAVVAWMMDVEAMRGLQYIKQPG